MQQKPVNYPDLAQEFPCPTCACLGLTVAINPLTALRTHERVRRSQKMQLYGDGFHSAAALREARTKIASASVHAEKKAFWTARSMMKPSTRISRASTSSLI